ncbi:MAG TPA: tetraacyldisaccharide 4'-kinase [Polyangiaceae bacterium]|jgi:tetraacyldisaccharide 4'-kinase|nr:tetraacyldisaccharide 4'-kinase [Polyangiaceae bacterium]
MARAAAHVWGSRARVARRCALPDGARVIGVGGPTLGGSYKTPLTLALARALLGRGEPVSVVGHGYGVRLDVARTVRTDDGPWSVGDDAAWLARALHDSGGAVFVGDRASAIRMAARADSAVLVDGLLQSRPRRLSLSLLALDAVAPWGSGACPPAGDLRAPKDALLEAADALVVVHAAAPPTHAPFLETTRPLFHVGGRLAATLGSDGSPVALESLAAARVGVVLAIARPSRVLESLDACGIRPTTTRFFADHATPHAYVTPRRSDVDFWLTTPKCATKLEARYESAPLVVLNHELSLPDDLVALCRAARGVH